MFVTACCCMVPGGSSATPSPKADKDLQDRREKLIKKFQSEGVIGSIENTRGTCVVQVGAAFKATGIDDKRTLANLLFAWAFAMPTEGGKPEIGDHVLFIDDKTGKDYAKYTMDRGLRID